MEPKKTNKPTKKMPASGKGAKILVTIGLCLLFAIPVLVVFSAFSAPSLPNVAGYEYLAMTDCHGAEYVYEKDNLIFLSVASAFTSAKHTREAPEWWDEDTPAVKLEFIKDGYAYPYSLYLSPYPLEAYLTDGGDNGYLLANDAATLLIATPAAGPALVGELPPAITLNGVEATFSMCEWTFYVLPDFGDVFTVSSGEYLSENTDPHPISVDEFSCSFSEQPKSISFTIYRGDLKLLETPAPDFSTLPKGAYQMIVLAEFDRDLEAVRAGYSFSFVID